MAAFELGIALAFSAALIKGIQSLLMKRNAIETDEYVTAWSTRFFALPVLLIAISIFGIPEIGPGFAISVIAISVLLTGATLFVARAHKLSDISLISPMLAFTPALLLFTSPFILSESVPLEGIPGILLVTFGAFYLKSEDTESLVEPFRRLFNERGVRFMLLAVLIYSVTANIDKIGVESSSPIFWALSVHTLTSLMLLPVMLRKSVEWKTDIKDSWKPLTVLGLLGGISIIAQFTALKFTLVAYVISVKRLSIPISVVLGILIFREEDARRRIIGSLIMIAGGIAIYLVQ